MSGIAIGKCIGIAVGRCLMSSLLLTCLVNVALGQEPTADGSVVAKVGEFVVRRQAVDNEIPMTGWRKGLGPSQIRKVESAALQRIIERYIVFDYLKSHDQTLGKGEVQVQKEALIAELAKYEKTLVDYLKEEQVTESELEFRFAWQAAWKRYLADKLTEANLELHFNNQRRKFDGTKLRVAHLLVKATSKEEFAKALALTGDVKKQLDAGTLSWQRAVQEYSQGSLKNQGEIGIIERIGAMPQSFSNAAFMLKQGQISPPVTTGVGVHLIKCTEVIAGTRGWRDARKAVEKDAQLFLFNVIVKRHQGKVKVTKFDWSE